MAAYVGTSGWSYDHWYPELYPPGLPAATRLACYTASFRTAELNSSFYRWPGPARFRALAAATARRVSARRAERRLRLIPEWLRVAVEFRHPSWHCEDVYRLLEKANAVRNARTLRCMLGQ